MSSTKTITELKTMQQYPPGPQPKFPGSLLFAIQHDPLKSFVDAAHQYGDLVHFRIGAQHFYLLNHPDLIQEVLVTHNRVFHKSRELRMAARVLGNGLLTSEDEFHLSTLRTLEQFSRPQSPPRAVHVREPPQPEGTALR